MSINSVRRAITKTLATGAGQPDAVVIPGTLAVTGASTLTGDVAATGAVSVGTTLAVTGATALTGALTANDVRKSAATTTASGDIVLTAASPSLQRIDANGSHRNVDLPALTGTSENGMSFEFQNVSGTAVNLVVRLTGGGATVVTVNQTEKATCTVIAGAWVHTGVIAAALT